MENNKIVEKVFIKGEINLISPISIGNGIEDATDNDLLVDGDGKIFIPGTSIAGSVRSYLESVYDNKVINRFMGSSEEDGAQSAVYFYDAHLKESGRVSVRDGIALQDFLKVTKEGAKYNYEVAERDNVFSFKLELLVRKWDEKHVDEFNNIIACIIKAIEEGVIRIGGKAQRGLGRVCLSNLECVAFDFRNKDTLNEFLKFGWNKKFNLMPVASKRGSELINTDSVEINKGRRIKIEVPLKLIDTLFIRNYLLENDDVDAEQLCYDDRFIIPGTTWSGAFRHRMFMMLYDLLDEKMAKEILNILFGEKAEDKKGLGHKSNIVFEESISNEKCYLHEIRRTKIDRFTGGAYDSGLFESRVATNGETVLSIWINNYEEYQVGLVLVCLFDLISGLLAVGGETSIGRGILSTSTDLSLKKEMILINEVKLDEEVSKVYLSALKNKLKEVGECHEV